MTDSAFQIVYRIISSVSDISQVRIDLEVRRANKFYIFHRFFYRIHKRCFHCFKSKNNAAGRRVCSPFTKTFQKQIGSIRPAFLVIHIVARYLYNANSSLTGKINSTFDNFKTFFPNGNASATEGKFSLGGQAHGTYRKPSAPNLLQRIRLYPWIEKPRKA